MAGQELAYLSKEQRLIEEIKAIVGLRFLGDDCARVAGGVLLTVDTFVEGTHFLLRLAKPRDIGWKAMAANLSDLAAMAGMPRFALVALTVPDYLSRKQFVELYEGLAECARLYDTVVVGGDITSGPVLSLSISMVGHVHEYGCLKRSGALPGDVIVVTGHFGASAAGLEVLLKCLPARERRTRYKHAERSDLSNRARLQAQAVEQVRQAYPICVNQHFRPSPRLLESWQFVKRTGGRGALMDASDGLADALAQIARASKVGMQINLSEIPVHEQTGEIAQDLHRDPLDLALYGGEDYELVGCLPAPVWESWAAELPPSQIPFKKIGEVNDRQRIELLSNGQAGIRLDLEKCFQHIAKLD